MASIPPLATLELTVGSTLEVLEANAKTIHVTEPTLNPSRVATRLLDLRTNRFILRYTPEREGSGWTIEINGDSPEFSVKYDFLSRKLAFLFQKYITGYDQYQDTFGEETQCENIRCGASIKRKMVLGRPQQARDVASVPRGGARQSPWRQVRDHMQLEFPLGCDDYGGEGEVQLWIPFEGSAKDNAFNGSWDTASMRSTTTTATTSSALAPWVTHQSNGDTSTIANEARSPLIMIFLRDLRGEGRTMLRINLHKVKWILGVEDDIQTLSFSGSHGTDKSFPARRLSVRKEDMNKWDVCAMARKVKSKGTGIEEITVASLALKIKRDPVPDGAPAPLSRLGKLEQRLEELKKTVLKDMLETAKQTEHQMQRAIIASQNAPSGIHSGQSSNTLSSVPAATINAPIELGGDYEQFRPSAVRVPAATEMEYSIPSLSPPTNFPLEGRKPSSLSRRPSPFQSFTATPVLRLSLLQAQTAEAGSASAYSYTAYNRHAPPEVPSTLVEELTSQWVDKTLPVVPTQFDSSDDEDSAIITDFDQRARRALHAEPSISSAAESTIRALHSLPEELRALVYGFPGFTLEGGPEVDASEVGSLASRSVTSSNTAGKLFRCPFNIANPQQYWKGGCAGPGYRISKLGQHLEDHHLSYECPLCKRDCLDDEGLELHTCNGLGQSESQGASRQLNRGISERKLRKIKKMLKPSKKEKVWDEDRWFQMWEELFPESSKRPEPYFAPRGQMERPDLRRLEIVFDAMVEADGGGMNVSKAKTKLYLRAAIQAVEDRAFKTCPSV